MDKQQHKQPKSDSSKFESKNFSSANLNKIQSKAAKWWSKLTKGAKAGIIFLVAAILALVIALPLVYGLRPKGPGQGSIDGGVVGPIPIPPPVTDSTETTRVRINVLKDKAFFRTWNKKEIDVSDKQKTFDKAKEDVERDIDKQKNDLKGRFGSSWEIEWKKVISKAGYREEENYKQSLIKNKLTAKFKPKIQYATEAVSINDKDKYVKKWCSDTPVIYDKENRICVKTHIRPLMEKYFEVEIPFAPRHILIKFEFSGNNDGNKLTGNTFKASPTSIRNLFYVLKRLFRAKQEGSDKRFDFAATAGLFSEDGSKNKGGFLDVKSIRKTGFVDDFNLPIFSTLVKKDLLKTVPKTPLTPGDNNQAFQEIHRIDLWEIISHLNESIWQKFNQMPGTVDWKRNVLEVQFNDFDNINDGDTVEILRAFYTKLNKNNAITKSNRHYFYIIKEVPSFNVIDKTEQNSDFIFVFGSNGFHLIQLDFLEKGKFFPPGNDAKPLEGLGFKMLKDDLNKRAERQRNEIVYNIGKSYSTYIDANYMNVLLIQAMKDQEFINENKLEDKATRTKISKVFIADNFLKLVKESFGERNKIRNFILKNEPTYKGWDSDQFDNYLRRLAKIMQPEESAFALDTLT